MADSLCAHPVPGALDTGRLGTVRAAVHGAVRLDAVPDDLAAAVVAGRRDRMDGALEAVEHVGLAAASDLHRLVVLVAAHLALRHPVLLRSLRFSIPGTRGVSLPSQGWSAGGS